MSRNPQDPPQHAPQLVIIGRPNVGKSTLFNRLLGRKRSLVHDQPGVTRDRIIEEARWWVHGKAFPIRLVDTGGIGGEHFSEEIEGQVRTALAEADVVILLLDGKSGLTAMDEELLRRLKQSGLDKKVPLLAVVNKIDAEVHEDLGSEFYALGIEPLLTISAEHARGIDDLQLAVATQLGFDPAEAGPELSTEADSGIDEETGPDSESEAARPSVPRIAIVGRPNVGKSTLVNALLKEERMIVSAVAGTTVDAVDSLAELDGKPYILIDTAGIRRKSKTEKGVEVLSVVQTRKALEKADVAILVLDGESGITEQDEKIGGLIEDAGCSVILAVNKWDTQKRTKGFSKNTAAGLIRREMGFLSYAPILFISAKKNQGLEGLGELIEEILHQRKLKVPTHEFTEWVRNEATVHNPMSAKFYLCHQSGRHPPTFVCHVNDPEKIHFSLKRHLVNALRERWGYMGTPVRLLFVQGANQRRKPSTKASTR